MDENNQLNTATLLQSAIDNKEKIQVIYHGGSMAGKLREISPISINGVKLRAKCHVSEALKTFIIDKMQVLKESTGEISQEIIRDKIRPKFKELSELHQYCVDRLDANLYVIKKDDDILTIHSLFKNGKPKKVVELGIFYEEYGTRFTDDSFTEHEIYLKQKPWGLIGKKVNSVSYKYFNKATDTFIDMFECL